LTVTHRWNWDFEEQSRARPSVPAHGAAPSESPPPPQPERGKFQRRRVGVLAAVVVVLVVALIVALPSHRRSAASTPHAAVLAHGGAAAPRVPAASSPALARDAVRDVLAYTPFVAAGGGRRQEVALTFDDGPGPYTPGVLSVLEREHAPATFFAIGKMTRYFGAYTRRELQDGDVVGDHTQSHAALASLSAHAQREELFEGIARIELLGSPRPQLFRPPYGSFNATTLRQLHALRLLMVLWSADTRDYTRPGVPAIVDAVIAGATPGAIFLMHDGGGDRSQTVAALPGVIRALRARGYELVTVPQLMRDDPPPAGLPIPHSLAGD
jgi:peptidoglycan/xylan/chitin deacetylase (PgdA/CDA1 family)